MNCTLHLLNISKSFLPGGMNSAGANVIAWMRLVNTKGELTLTMAKSTSELYGE